MTKLGALAYIAYSSVLSLSRTTIALAIKFVKKFQNSAKFFSFLVHKEFERSSFDINS